MKNKILIPAELIARMAQALRMLSHPQRLRLVEWLDLHGAAPVHELVNRLEIPQAVVSLHLNQMRRAGLVAGERRRREMWYTVADRSAITILDCMRRKAAALRRPRGGPS